MFGAVTKSYYADVMGIPVDKIVSVASCHVQLRNMSLEEIIRVLMDIRMLILAYNS